MSGSLLIDNWALQDVGECLATGLTHDEASILSIDADNNTHCFRDVPSSGIQIEALLELLVNIVLRDALYVDSEYVETWAEHESVFAPLLTSGMVRGVDFPAEDDALAQARKQVLQRLCVTESLKQEQRKNERSWSADKSIASPYISAVLWGAAGMLARSQLYETPYSGHPLRKRIIEQTLLAPPPRDIVAETRAWVTHKRLHVFETSSTLGAERKASVLLPPIAIDIINEASDISQLIPVAYQMRDKYAPLREWLKQIQLAIDNDDPHGSTKYKRILNAVSRDLDRALGKTEAGKISLQIGIGWPGISIDIGSLDRVMSRFGVRAMINKLIITSSGESIAKKLLNMFDESGTETGMAALMYLRSHQLK